MSIEQDLRRRLKHYGLENAFDASRVCAVASEVAKGDFVPVSFAKGVLKVSVLTAGKGHLLKINQNKILNEINEKLQGKKVTRLVIFVGSEGTRLPW